MEKATIKLSRKIQLNIDLPTTEERKEVWEKLQMAEQMYACRKPYHKPPVCVGDDERFFLPFGKRKVQTGR